MAEKVKWTIIYRKHSWPEQICGCRLYTDYFELSCTVDQRVRATKKILVYTTHTLFWLHLSSTTVLLFIFCIQVRSVGVVRRLAGPAGGGGVAGGSISPKVRHAAAAAGPRRFHSTAAVQNREIDMFTKRATRLETVQ